MPGSDLVATRLRLVRTLAYLGESSKVDEHCRLLMGIAEQRLEGASRELSAREADRIVRECEPLLSTVLWLVGRASWIHLSSDLSAGSLALVEKARAIRNRTLDRLLMQRIGIGVGTDRRHAAIQ